MNHHDQQYSLILALLALALIAILWGCTGCKAVHGLGNDLCDWTAPYAEAEE